MAIQVGGTQVISNSQGLTNITSVDATTAAAIGNAGVGAPATGTLGGGFEDFFGFTDSDAPTGSNGFVYNGLAFKIGSNFFVACNISGAGRGLAKYNGSSWSLAANWQGSNNAAWGGSHTHNRSMAWDGSNVYMIAFNSYNGGLLRSTDGGANWTISNIVGGSYRYNDSVCWAGSGYWLALQQLDNGIYLYRSTNNGSSWSQVANLVSAAGNPRSLYSSGSTTIFVGYDGFYRSTNFKTGWSVSQAQAISGLNTRQIIRTNGSGNWVTSEGYWSTDDGQSWNSPSNYPPNSEQNLIYKNGYFISLIGEFYAYTTTGATWTYVPSGFSPVQNPTSLIYRTNFDNPSSNSTDISAWKDGDLFAELTV